MKSKRKNVKEEVSEKILEGGKQSKKQDSCVERERGEERWT